MSIQACGKNKDTQISGWLWITTHHNMEHVRNLNARHQGLHKLLQLLVVQVPLTLSIKLVEQLSCSNLHPLSQEKADEL
jgi:hypothetical protein